MDRLDLFFMYYILVNNIMDNSKYVAMTNTHSWFPRAGGEGFSNSVSVHFIHVCNAVSDQKPPAKQWSEQY